MQSPSTPEGKKKKGSPYGGQRFQESERNVQGLLPLKVFNTAPAPVTRIKKGIFVVEERQGRWNSLNPKEKQEPPIG